MLHVVASVGWIGAIAAFLALAAVARWSADDGRAASALLAMDVVARYVIVPASVASLLTGVVQSMLSAWGLLRHWWVVFKLGINVFASVVLLVYVQSLGDASRVAARAGATIPGDGAVLRDPTHLLHGTLAIVLLRSPPRRSRSSSRAA